MHLGGTIESVLDAGTDIFRADVTLKFCLLHELCGLLSGTTDKQRPAGSVHLIGQITDGTESGGVDGGHISET